MQGIGTLDDAQTLINRAYYRCRASQDRDFWFSSLSANCPVYATFQILVCRAYRGYSIPLIDLAGEKQRQVIVDKETGQYLGHPTTVLLEDGKTIIAVYPKGHGKGAIQMKRSTDSGLRAVHAERA